MKHLVKTTFILIAAGKFVTASNAGTLASYEVDTRQGDGDDGDDSSWFDPDWIPCIIDGLTNACGAIPQPDPVPASLTQLPLIQILPPLQLV